MMTHSGPVGKEPEPEPEREQAAAQPAPEVNESALVGIDDSELGERERRRKAAILRAVGLDKVPEEQRELAIAIARRYDLDLMLKHLVLVDGRPYITRDALLWVAHRSGVFDGLQLVTGPELRDIPELGKCWYAEVEVFRRDMARPFRMPGRYPVGGRNKLYGPEMAIKVAESMALRRAFNVSAATVEEQWETPADAPEPQTPKTLGERIAERAAAIEQQHAEPESEVVEGEVRPVDEQPASPDQGETLGLES